MNLKRVVACLDVDGERVVKGTAFVQLRDIGDPVALAQQYERDGADELVLLDISASVEGRRTVFGLVRRIAETLFIPMTLGGGIRTVADVAEALRAGADKVSINSAALARPQLLTECAARFGAQCVVASIDAKRVGERFEVLSHGGRQSTGREALAWARECVERGAGEVLLTSIDRDGARSGYDCELLAETTGALRVPVVASGGAGRAEHLYDAFRAGAEAALVAGILHDGTTTIRQLKSALLGRGVAVRPT